MHLLVTWDTVLVQNEPVTTMIMEAVIPTLILIVVSSCIMLPFGYMVGYFIGTRPHTRYANGIRGFAQVMTSMPEYWLAILFIYYLEYVGSCYLCR